MSIALPNEASAVSTPVVKRQKIGEKFVGAIVRIETRDSMRKNEEGVWVADTWSDGNAKKEFVIHCLAMPNTTCEAGIGENTSVPEPGDEVRVILKGGSFKEFKEARKLHRNGSVFVGDVFVQKMEFAQTYDASKRPAQKLTDQAAVDKLPRSTVVGIYGPLSLHEPKDNKWVAKAEEAYRRQTAVEAAVEAAPPVRHDDEDEPF